MANKYIIHGATYCGDGTASNEAASAGAAGAWNNIDVFEGTAPAYGTLAAGDMVYIRSLDSANAAITRTLTATVTLGNAAGAATNRITWIIDGGTIWPGVNGVITYNCPSTYMVAGRAHNNYIAENKWGLKIVEQNPSPNYKGYLGVGGQNLKNVFLDFSAAVAGAGSFLTQFGDVGSSNNHLDGLKIRMGVSQYYPIRSSGYISVYVTDIEIELTVYSGVFAGGIFTMPSPGGELVVIGGRVYGAGCTDQTTLLYSNAASSSARIYGLLYPNVMKKLSQNYTNDRQTKIVIHGSDANAGTIMAEWWGIVNSRIDGYYPTLNAVLPTDSSVPWSWHIYAPNAVASGPHHYGVCNYVSSGKFYTETAAAKTITLEALLATTITGADKGTLWIDVQYIDDTTGLPVFLSTRVLAGGALDVSTAGWSATSYGAIFFDKKKFSLTTPSPIKKDTMIYVWLRGYVKSNTANDIMFVCPDFILS